MKTKLSLVTLALAMGLAQSALADSAGTWGCPAMLTASSTHVQAAVIRVWNWSDGGDVFIEDVKVFDNDGVPRAVVFSPAQLGPHQAGVLIVHSLLGVPLIPGPPLPLLGLQVIVKWRTKGGGQPLAEVSWNVTSTTAGLTSTDTRRCYDLK